MSQEVELIDWEKVEDAVFEKSKEAISYFAQTYPDQIFSCFAVCLTDNPYGGFIFGFDNYANSIQGAKQRQNENLERIKRILHSKEDTWEEMYWNLRAHRITPYNPSMAYFPKYSPDFELWFEDWEEYRGRNSLPTDKNNQGSYLIYNSVVVVLKVFEKLIESDSFESLKRASPFYLGYQILEDDEELKVVYILNWPDLNSSTQVMKL